MQPAVRLTPAAYLDHLRADAATIGRPAAALSAPVPGCPGWDVASLVGHTGTIHRWVTAMVGSGATERLSRRELPDPPAREELTGWFREGAATLAATLEAAGTSRPVWNWSPTEPRTSSFWFRRMAQETAVHRWDAESAAGVPAPIPAELAVDGIDEMFEVHLPLLARGDGVDLGGSLHLHAIDAEGEWTLLPGGPVPSVERGHAKGDAAVRGSASALLLALWGRDTTGDLELFGDPAVLSRWREQVRF